MDKEKRLKIKNIVITVLVIFMFVGIILAFYGMLYAEKRNSITKDGKVSTERTADEVNDYLLTSIDAIKLTAYTLDDMIANNSPHDEIQKYLEGQSVAVISTVFENSKGLYGYIDGQYHDGSRWVPDDDYIPTERPWYQAAIKKPGAVVFVDPYVDAQTGNVMMSLSKVLMDNLSVVSMDIYLDKLQEIAEAAVESDGADIEFILDSNNMVIAHSEADEIGKIYTDENNSMGAEIVKKISATNKDFFEFQYEGTHYVAYKVEIKDDWKCVSVKNASSVFDPLNVILVLTIAAVIVVIFTISILMTNASKKQLLAEKLSSQLSSTADIYVSLHEIDLLRDTITEVRNDNETGSGTKIITIGDSQEQILKMMDVFTDESSREGILDFVDLAKLDHRLKGKNTITMEFLNKEKKWCRARFIVSSRIAGGRIGSVMFLIEDIDDEMQKRDELIDMSEKALAASEAKSSFLSHMSHEIRTPINAILGMNEIILRESRDESITTYASNIKTAGNSLLGLINDILDFSKIEAGKMEIIQIDYDISSVINDLVNLIQSRADAKGLQLLLEIDPNIPKMLHGDEVRIKQVITNILTNAVKYTDKGSVTLGLAYEKIPEAPDAIYLDVYIKDTGMGIKSEDLPKLFAEFERIDEEKNRNIEGTGLGMSIIKRLLDMMGSTLKVDSIYGLGSRFSFRLRQKVLKWEPLGDYEAAYRNSLAERGKYREKFIAPKAQVLCVDDNEMNRVVFRSLIKNTLVKSDMAVDGYEALEMSRDKKYDIIFMDYLMPGKDGTETLNDIRKEEGNPNLTTPVICLTANAVSGARDEFIAAGFDDYLTKPIDPDVLEHMIMEYLPDELIELTVEGDAEDRKTDHTHPEVPVELEPLTNLDVIDVFRGIKNSGGADLYLNTLKVFYESIDVKVNELNGFYAEKDTYNYRIKVHALKSSLRLIGADGLGEEAQGLEDAAKNQKPDYIAAHHDEFIAKCESLKGPLANVFIKDETEENKIEDDKTEADAGLIADAYKEIREAAEEMSCDKLDEIYERMSEYTIPENAAPMWNDVKNAADSFDYQGVLSLLDKLD